MKGIVKWLSKNRKTIWFSFALNILAFVVFMLLMNPIYETNDDICINMLVNGSAGTYQAITMCQNVVLGKFYCFLYETFGNALPWYGLIQCGIIMLSFTVLTYVLMNRFKETVPALCIWALLMIFFGYECYVKMQYSKTSAVAVCAAALLVYGSAASEKINWRGLLLAIFLGMIGFMYRDKVFLASLAITSGIGVYLLLNIDIFPKGERCKRLGSATGAFVVMLLIGAGLHIADEKAYTLDPRWSYYKEYDDLRTIVMDYSFPAYDEEKFKEIGLDETAYDMYTSWNFNDPEKVTVDTWKELIAMVPAKASLPEMIKNFCTQIPTGFFTIATFYVAMSLVGIWILFGKHDGRTVLTVIYEILIFLLVYFYSFYQGRYLINRVDTGMWLGFSLVFVWLLKEGLHKITKQTWIAFICAMLVMVQYHWSDSYRINDAKRTAQSRRMHAVYQEIKEDKEHLYLSKMANISNFFFGPYEPLEKGIQENIVWLGGWETNMVSTLQKLENYGVENPWRDCIDNDQVYIVDNKINLTLQYIRTYYNENVEAELVKTMEGLKVYRIVTEDS